MRNVAVWAPSANSPEAINRLTIAGHSIECGEVDTLPPAFDPQAEANVRSVLVRVKGFSCNYRDRGLISIFSKNNPGGRFYVIGSEFVGEVIAVGEEVTEFKEGDRVIADNAYAGTGIGQPAYQGIPTNHSSKEVSIFSSEQLFKVGPTMPLCTAASFSVAAQTVYSMIRKGRVQRGTRVLVTGGRSNTSLVAIAALKQRNAEIIVVTGSVEAKARLLQAGAHDVIVPDRNDLSTIEFSRRAGTIDVVIDPFSDIYLPWVLPCLGAGGRYVTCGVYAQGTDVLADGKGVAERRTWHAMTLGLLNNAEIHLNCLGTTADLALAYQDYLAGSIDIQVDSEHRDGMVRDFLYRTYVAGDRWGKVAYIYD
jgi:NADPH:quinone reductase-like Zn-dependent oxidoreductase